MYDYVAIGAGIIGSSIARELSKYQLNVLVLEKESDVSNAQTSANSAIIHSGHDPREGSLKAKLCVRGNELHEKMESELSIPLLRTGAFVVAVDEESNSKLDNLYQRALANGVKHVELINDQKALEYEPNLTKNIKRVLSLPTTKVTYPWVVAFALMENAILNGVSIQFNMTVTDITRNNDFYKIQVNNHEMIETKGIINAAGLFSDDIAKMIDQIAPFSIKPKKGEYLVLDKDVKGFVSHILYPLPTISGKGVLVVPQVHGNLLLGPTSQYIDDETDFSNTYQGIEAIKKNATMLAENIPFDKVIRTFAGVRASSDHDDFYIRESLFNPNFYHLGAIDSPGLTAAPAIAEYLVKMINEKRHLILKNEHHPVRKANIAFSKLSHQEKSNKD